MILKGIKSKKWISLKWDDSWINIPASEFFAKDFIKRVIKAEKEKRPKATRGKKIVIEL